MRDAWVYRCVVVAAVGGASGWCAGQPPAPFTNEAAARGINFFTPYGTSAGRGMAFADLDNDGDPDLICLGGPGNTIGLFQNDGTGRFVDRRSGSGLAATPNNSGVVVADYDGDGLLDIYISRFGDANRLYRNLGNFTFVNVTTVAGVGNAGAGTGCSWGDFDGDGWLDLYVANQTSTSWPVANSLYRNRGDGTFVDVGPSAGVVHLTGLTWQGTFFDYDRDGDVDLYINSDKGVGSPDCARHNFHFRNDASAFADVTDLCRTAACIDAMGLALGDVNGDLRPDMYITNTPSGNHLYLSRPDGSFDEAGGEYGVRSFATGWGAAFFDFDNDGDLDLYVCNQDAQNRMYVNGGAAPWTNMGAALGVNWASDVGFESYIVAVADVDNDGDLDMAVESLNSTVRLFINHEGERRGWVKFRVRGPAPNVFAYGAHVDVRTGDVWRSREVLGAGGFKSHDDTVLHFGLGGADRIDEVVVTWPGGKVVRTLRGYAPGRTWTLYPPGALGDMDRDGDVDSADFFAFLDCFFGAAKGVSPGCEAGDFDGDGQMTSMDFFALLARLFG